MGFARIAALWVIWNQLMKWRPGRAQAGRIMSRPLRNWLLDRGSLTDRLITKSAGQFRVEVLRQYRGVARPDEARRLGLDERQAAWIREVVLYGNNTPWVFARSILPEKSLAHSLRHLKRLGNKPLGAVLFNDPHMYRSAIEIARFDARDLPVDIDGHAWGRRSVFYLRKQPLLVTEVFLPGLLS